MNDTFSAISRFYDLDMGDYGIDIAMYLEFARRIDAPVLELGVGSGRVALPLAEAGMTVVGIENSPSMLRLAQEKMAPSLASQLRLIEADMRDYHLERRFGLIFSALGSFCHLETAGGQMQSLSCARRHLLPDGLLVIDLPAFEPSAWEAGAHPLIHEWTRRHPQSGTWVNKLSSLQSDPATQIQEITYIFDETGTTGGVHRYTATINLRHVFRYEMEHLLARTGFKLYNTYGSYDLEPYDAQSSRMIFVAGGSDEKE